MMRIRKENINTLEHWDREWSQRSEAELIERFSVVAELLRRVDGKKVLDVGCGNALGYTHIKRIWGCEYFGTDFSEIAIRKARQAEPEAHFAVADVYSQPFDDNSFDAVLCQEVMEHVEYPEDLCRELLRVMRPGGAVIVTTPRGAHMNGCEEHVWSYENQDMQALFPGCAVRILSSKEVLPDLIIAVITKPL